MRPWLAAVLSVLLASAATAAPSGTAAEQVASIEQLRTQALEAFKVGNFDRTSELLRSAASLSDDPTLSQLTSWITQFQSQRQELASERRVLKDEAIADVRKLLDAGLESFAIDRAKDAYLLADDKDSVRAEPWLDDLVARSRRMASDAERSEQWFAALRLYADLSVIEPRNVEYRASLKSSMRRIRLLSMYAPDVFRALQDQETEARRQADRVIAPPTTQPTEVAADEDRNDAFRIEWREMLRGVRFDMLLEALDDARNNYWKPITYPQLVDGGLRGLRAVVTTGGLEQTFPGLADKRRVEVFLAALDESGQMLVDARPASEQLLVRSILSRLRVVNRDTVQLPEEVLVNEFADGALAELDPFTSMIWPFDMEDFARTTEGEFSGVGIQISSDADGSLKVVTPLEDSPAYRLGIQAGDIIAQINGKNAKGITLNQAVKTITGPTGTTVTLTIRSPDGTTREHTIRRETIKVASVKGWMHRPGGGWEYFIDPDLRIGYLRLTNFTRTSTEEMDKALRAMRDEGARALIFDIRSNPGGLLTAATEISDRFIRGGTIVSIRGERADVPSQPPIEATAGNEVDLPLIVLVNQLSASGSEIVAGALKDHGRATVVGERTFGKGSVQMLLPVAGRAAYLRLTTSHYYPPAGANIHREDDSERWGVDPDLTVEMTPKQMTDAMLARQELDVLRRDGDAPSTRPSRDPVAADPQLAAALLMLRLQLAGSAAG